MAEKDFAIIWSGTVMNAVLRPSTPLPPRWSDQACAPCLSSKGERRYLSLWFPFLSTDRLHRRLGQQAKKPLVLVEKQRGALRLAALDETARGLGLQPGMGLAEARAIVPALAVADVTPEEDRKLLNACAEAGLRFTPLVALDGKDGLLLDISGCAHLLGGEAGLLTACMRLMQRFGLHTRASIAATPEAAHAFSRFTRGGIFPADKAEREARNLPVTALEGETGTSIALVRAGLKTLGDLADRPSHALVARFGADLVTRLRAILGEEDRRITPLRPPPDFVAHWQGTEPLALLESVMAVLDRLIEDVVVQLEGREQGGRMFEATLFRADGAVRRIAVETSAPTRDGKILMRLFRLRIEALADPIDPGFGFDVIRLGVLRSEPLILRQKDMAGSAEKGETQTIEGLIDRLAARFGHENILRFIARDTHDPAQSAAAVPYLSSAYSAEWPLADICDVPIRPLTLFPNPHPIEVLAEVPDGPPIRFRWRRTLHEVTRAEGPERIAPQWWLAAAASREARDYYRVEDAKGHRFWLFREGFYGAGDRPPRWFVHGLFA